MSDYIDLEGIARRLVEIQTKSGLTAKAFSQETDLPSSTFSQIKSGAIKINVETINKVILRWGGAYNPMWFIFGDERSMHSSTDSADIASDDNQVSEALLSKVEEIGRLKQALEQAKPKEIERITVFYTDNSVAHYRLEQ